MLSSLHWVVVHILLMRHNRWKPLFCHSENTIQCRKKQMCDPTFLVMFSQRPIYVLTLKKICVISPVFIIFVVFCHQVVHLFHLVFRWRWDSNPCSRTIAQIVSPQHSPLDKGVSLLIFVYNYLLFSFHPNTPINKLLCSDLKKNKIVHYLVVFNLLFS